MRGHDIGIVADLDELFTHEFTIAIKACDLYSEFDHVKGKLSVLCTTRNSLFCA